MVIYAAYRQLLKLMQPLQVPLSGETDHFRAFPLLKGETGGWLATPAANKIEGWSPPAAGWIGRAARLAANGNLTEDAKSSKLPYQQPPHSCNL